MSDVVTVMLAGVGGQGTILAADLLAKVAAASGMDVKLSEVHGMSQRGGGVDTVVRFGEHVFAPTIGLGSVDHLVAFELLEARRQLPYLREGGTLLVNDAEVAPLGVMIGAVPMPVGIGDELRSAGGVLMDAVAIARESGSPKSANVVLMGSLSTKLPFDADVWRDVIARRVPPKTVDANLAAFDAGGRIMDREVAR